jgi:hypothetical protein
MKKCYLLLLIVCFAMNSAYSQSTNGSANNVSVVDPRIQEVYADQLNTLVLNVPNRIKDLNDILNNRVKIEEMRLESDEKYPKLSSVELFNKYNPNLTRDVVIDEANFNPLKYSLRFHAKTTLIYRIDNTNKVIVIYPQPVLKSN